MAIDASFFPEPPVPFSDITITVHGGDDRLLGGADDDVLFGDIGDDGEVDPSDPNSTTPFDDWAMPAIVHDSTFLFIGGMTFSTAVRARHHPPRCKRFHHVSFG